MPYHFVYLLALSMADTPQLLREGLEEVTLQAIRDPVPAPQPDRTDELVQDLMADMRGARKVPFVEAPAAEAIKLGIRDHQEKTGDQPSWTAVSLSGGVLRQVLLDPFAFACLLFVVAAFAANWALKATPKPERGTEDAVSFVSSTSRATRKSRAPDRFALVVNQKLTRLNTVDEVLDFMISSSETGRTDIVNVVTAIHRSAKLIASKSITKRVSVGQDPRMRVMLDQLLGFLEAGAPVSILSRAVGNTSWALAKLQYRQDPDQPHLILETLQKVFVAHAQDFRPEEMMNTVWAFAELRREKEQQTSETRSVAIAEAACKCIEKFPEFTVQQVVYFSWALARLSSISSVKHTHAKVREGLTRFTAKIVDRARPEIVRLDTKNLAMLSWAVASLSANLGIVGGDGAVLMAEIAELILEKGLWGFLPGEIASILWAVNKVHVKTNALYQLIHDHLLKKGLRGYSSQDLSTITCAFVKTGQGSDELYRNLAEAAMASAKDFNRSEKMMMHWAFTQLPHLVAPRL